MLQRDKRTILHQDISALSTEAFWFILTYSPDTTKLPGYPNKGSCALWIPTPFSFLKGFLASLPWSITLDSSSLVHQPLDFSCLSFSAFLLIFNTIRLQLLLVFCPKINIPTCWLCHLSLLVSGWDCQWSNLRPHIYWVNNVSLRCIPILHLEFFISQISLQWL